MAHAERWLYTRLAALIAASALFSAALTALVTWGSEPGPPMHIRSAVALTPVVQPGGEVHIQFEVERNRPCPALIHGFLVSRTDGRALHRFASELGGYSTVGVSKFTVTRAMPPNVTGPICYRHTRIDSCDTRSYVETGPEVCFEVRAAE